MPKIYGLTGVLRTAGDLRRGPDLTAMLHAMRRAPADDADTLVDDRLGIGAGWISRGEGADSVQPVWNERHDIGLLFLGEDYGEPVEFDGLRAGGPAFDPEDVTHLVQGYEKSGLKFLETINGSFCGLLLDLRERKVVLFNDRYGIRRIYFHEDGGDIFFSSEAKSLLSVLPHTRALDPRGLGEFLSCGCVLQNRTIFHGISLLPGASAWTFRPGQKTKKEFYFRKEAWEQQPTLNPTEYYERLKETWKRIVPRYFRGHERTGLSLTGGVDSRMILAWSPAPAGTLPCYTFGSRYRECADVNISRQIARLCGQSHEVIEIGAEFAARFPDLAAQTIYLSDGAMDVTGSVDLYVQERERQIAPVRITGTNGGEILRSLVAFKPTNVCRDVLDRGLDSWIQTAVDTYRDELQGHRLSFTAFKQAPWHMGCKFAIERAFLTLRMPYFDNDLIALVYQAPAECAANHIVSQRLIQDGNPRLGGIRTDRGGSLDWLPGVAQARHLFQEFTFKAEYAYDYGMPQSLARLDHALASLHLERLFLGRHKIHHFRVLYRDEQADYLRDVLLDPRALGRSYLRREQLTGMLEHHLKGDRNYTLEIHKLLTIELIQRELIEKTWSPSKRPAEPLSLSA